MYTFDISTFVDAKRIIFDESMMLREVAENTGIQIYLITNIHSIVRIDGDDIEM